MLNRRAVVAVLSGASFFRSRPSAIFLSGSHSAYASDIFNRSRSHDPPEPR